MTVQKEFSELNRSELYPSDLYVQFRFEFRPSCPPFDLLRVAQRAGCREIKFAIRNGQFQSNTFGRSLPISVEQADNYGDILINVHLSTRRYVWEVEHDHGYGPLGQPNLPHPDEILRNKRPIWDYADQMLHHVSRELTELLNPIAANIKDTLAPQLISMRMREVEVTADVSASSSTASVTGLKIVRLPMLEQDSSNEHTARANMGVQVDHETQLLAGYRISDSERYRLCSMGSRLILSGKLTDAGVRSAGIYDVMSCEPGKFIEFFDQVATYVVPKANKVILAWSASPYCKPETAVSEANSG